MYTIITSYDTFEVNLTSLHPDSKVGDLLSFLPTREVLCDEHQSIIYDVEEPLASSDLPEVIYTLNIRDHIRRNPEFFKKFYETHKCFCEDHLILALNTIFFPEAYKLWVNQYVTAEAFESMIKLKSLLNLCEIRKEYLYDFDFVSKMTYTQCYNNKDLIEDIYGERFEDLVALCKSKNIFPFLSESMRANTRLNILLVKAGIFPLHSLCSSSRFIESLKNSAISYTFRDIETLTPDCFKSCIRSVIKNNKIYYSDIFLIPKRLRTKELYCDWLKSENSDGLFFKTMKNITEYMIDSVLDNPKSNGMYVIIRLYKTINKRPDLFFRAVNTKNFKWIPFEGQVLVLSNQMYVCKLLETSSRSMIIDILKTI